MFWIDIEDSSGDKYGQGPIISAPKWQSVLRLDKAGTFSTSIPAIDSKSSLIQPRRILRCYTKVKDETVEIGNGIIDKIETSTSRDGVFLNVSGDDLLRELTHRSVGFLEIDEPTDGKVGLTYIAAFFPSGWSYDTVNGYSSTDGDIYAAFAGESCLSALNKISGKLGEHFRLGSGRKVVWLRTDQPSSNIRAIQPNVTPVGARRNQSVCLIDDLQETKDTYELFTRIYPFGAGNGRDRLDLFWSTLSLPAGYTVNTTLNYIENDTAVDTYGVVERYASYKDIAPISNSAADLEYASNYLASAAFNELSRAIQINRAYNVNVSKLDTIVYPGETIQVVYYTMLNGIPVINIDEDLIVLESTIEITQTGAKTTQLQVSTVDKWPQNDLDLLSGQMQEGKVLEAHPQMSVGYFSEHFGLHSLDSTHNADMSFKFGDEVTKLNRALLWFQTDLFETTATSASGGGGGVNTTEGGGQVAKATEGGGQVAETGESSNTASSGTDSTDHIHVGTVYDIPGSAAEEVFVGNAGGLYHKGVSITGSKNFGMDSQDVDHSHDIDHDHDVSIDAHSHDVSIDAHSHDVSLDAHSHDLNYGINRQAGVYPGPISLLINGTDRTSALGGGPGWGDAVSQTDEEVNITSYVNIHSSTNTLRFTAGGGEGRIKVNLRAFVTVQAILFS